MLRCDQMQSLSSSFEFKKSCHINCFKSCVPFCFHSLSLSHRRRPVELAWRTFVWDTSSASFSAFGARFPTIPPGDPRGFRCTQGTRWHSRPLAPSRIVRTSHRPWPVEGLASPTAQLRQWQLFSFAMSSCVSSSAFSLPPDAHLLFSCLLPVQLYSHFCSHFCDWLVSHGLSPVTFTQWCFGCSSGKRVSMFVLFLSLPRLKYQWTKLHTGLAPF